MSTKLSPEELQQEEKELKQMFREAAEQTPKDPRNLTVIYWKKGQEIHESAMSLDRVNSSFAVAKKNLKNRRSHQGKSTLGWIRKGIKVYREIDRQGISQQFLKDNPDQKEKYFTYGFCDYFQTITKFIVQDRKGDRKVYYIYSEPRSNEHEDIDLD